ncbi:soybean gene regulated by cold-2 [Striga hermonthica]|uniref:Soybean gene regulated by cold-2 n=1 Tax=Striga hermonthica TaxID=68872 RepID=A0A9N7N213_STRHE|nr:soybean gene regulated by cold-2 [Striga hermonthica]
MECRTFEITLISAHDLEDVRKICKMKVYARVSIGGGGHGPPANEKRTPPDKHGQTNPAWNFMMRYTISERMLESHNSSLVVKLYCKRKLGDRYVGEVHTSMKELFECSKGSGGAAVLCFPVQRGCVNSQGGLRFSYRFGEKLVIDKLLLAEGLGGWIFS